MTDTIPAQTAADLIATALAAFADSHWVAMDTEHIPTKHEGAMDIQDFVNILTDQVCFNDVLETIATEYYDDFELTSEQTEIFRLYLDWRNDAVDDEWRDQVFGLAVKNGDLIGQVKWLVRNTEKTIRNLERALKDMRAFLNA